MVEKINYRDRRIFQSISHKARLFSLRHLLPFSSSEKKQLSPSWNFRKFKCLINGGDKVTNT